MGATNRVNMTRGGSYDVMELVQRLRQEQLFVSSEKRKIHQLNEEVRELSSRDLSPQFLSCRTQAVLERIFARFLNSLEVYGSRLIPLTGSR